MLIQAWQLLADYETLSTYMPNVDTSLLPDFLLAYIVRRQIDRMMRSLVGELARRTDGY